MRKIIVYIATSADGFIARPDGGIDWLDRPQTAGDYGMARFYRSIDTVILGRKTYDVALAFGQTSYANKKNYVFSRRRGRTGAEVEFTAEPVGSFAQRLRREPGKHVWLVGGGEIIASFLDANQVDEFVIHVIPTFIGEGIPLIAPRHRTVPLTLLSTQRYSDGIVRLHYAVERPGSTGRATRRPVKKHVAR
jgi:dihydrofolate reductase